MENFSDLLQYMPEQAQNLNIFAQLRHPCRLRCVASKGNSYAGPMYRFYKQTTARFSNLRCYLSFLVLNVTSQYDDIYRFQNVFLRCPTPRLRCFPSSHWPSFRILSFMAFFIPSNIRADKAHVGLNRKKKL